jgi:catechol 2,3-dioxygenase-like lactoylglutathione lyase family enzyme
MRKLFAALVLLIAVVDASHAAVREVRAIGITVADLPRALAFYTNVLPFRVVAHSEIEGVAYGDLFNLPPSNAKVAELELGAERISLFEHAAKGRAVPHDSRSYDHWFQHIAIVVSDMEQAYDQLRRHKVRHVSSAPQTLPAWNTNAGGIKAFYFIDPEGHVLEIIWFPEGKGDPKWQAQTDRLFLGIDHTAIVVSDTDESLRFYRDALGFRVAGESENYGPEQERLNQVFGARLRITALRAPRGPGIEFLEYIAPPGGRPLWADAKANDLVFWSTELVVDSVDHVSGRRISKRPMEFSSRRTLLVRDPDGHALRFVEPMARLSSN